MRTVPAPRRFASPQSSNKVKCRALATHASPPSLGDSSTDHVAHLDTAKRHPHFPEAKPFSSFLTDTHSRQHDYLRISVTERCNLRCTYCMPEEGVPLSPPRYQLTASEIAHLSVLFVRQGVTKIRLTGGEPTVRKDIVPLMQQIGGSRRYGLRELCLTTNGLALHRKLDAMAEAGLTGVNISLDTLDPYRFQIMTRRKGLDAVLRSVDRILEMNGKFRAGIKLKVNCVVIRGVNDHEVLDFVEMGRDKDLEVRFIEYMPFDGNRWKRNKLLPYQEMLDMIRAKYPNIRKVQADSKNDTSKLYEVPGFAGRVGFITSMTDHFCGSCNRLRITSDGNLKVCLFGNAEVSLRDILRENNGGNPFDEETRVNQHTDARLLDAIGQAVMRKKAKHAGIGQLEHMKNRPMILIAEEDLLLPDFKSHNTTIGKTLSLPPYVSYRTVPFVRNALACSSMPLPRSTMQARMYSNNASPTGGSHAGKARLPHLDEHSEVHMINVGSKAVAHRTALASGIITFSRPETLALIQNQRVRKGDVLAVARVAGIQAVKKTADLIPLAHNALPIEGVTVHLLPFPPREPLNADKLMLQSGQDQGATYKVTARLKEIIKDVDESGIAIIVSVEATAKTGVEMEALAGVMGTALTVIDMVKGADKGVAIRDVRVLGKKGGRSGAWGVFASDQTATASSWRGS